MATVIRKDDKPNEIALTVTVDSSALDRVEEKLLRIASLGRKAQLSEPLVLTLEQIKELARFAEEEGQPSYTITTGTIPAFEAEDGEMVAEYNGLIAYSDSEEHSVLQLS